MTKFKIVSSLGKASNMRTVHILTFFGNSALAAFWFVFLFASQNDHIMIIVLAHLGMSSLLFFPVFCRLKVSAFDPLNLFLLYVIIGGIAPAYYMVFDPTSRISYLMANRPLEDFVDVSFLYIASLFLVGLGYSACKQRINVGRLLPREDLLSPRGFQFALVAGISISLLGVLAYISSTGGIAASISDISRKRSIEIISNGEVVYATGGYMRMAADISFVLLLVTMSYYVKNSAKLPTYISLQLWVLGALSLAVPFISSSRSAVIFVAFGIMISLHARNRLSARVILVCAILAVCSFGAMSALRAASQKSGESAFENPFKALAESGNGLSIFGTTHIVKGVPDRMRYQLGTTYFYWITAPIPRTFWPGKPDIALGKRVKDEILQLPVIRSGRPPSFMGEGWMNFGLVGFMLNSFALGYMMRLIPNSLLPAMRYSSFAVPIYFTTALNVSALANSAISQGIVRIATDLALLLVVYILIQHSFSKRRVLNINSRREFNAPELTIRPRISLR